jgi:hypothetical protein
MFPKNELIAYLPGPKGLGWYWRIAVPLLAICTLAIGAAPALATPGGGEAVPSSPFELPNTVTTLCLTDEGYGFVDTEVCTAGDRAQLWQQGESFLTAHRLINLNSGQCLENDSYSGDYGNLRTAPCINDSTIQAWTGLNLFSDPTAGAIPGSHSLVNLQTGLCLESNISVVLDTGPLSGNAYAQHCTAWHWQYWALPAS